MSSPNLTALGIHAPGGAFTLGVHNAGFSVAAVLGGRSNFGADTHRLNFPSTPWHSPEGSWPTVELSETNVDLIYSNPVPGDSHSHACFVAGTPVLTTHGPKPIEQVRPGDLVMTYRSDRFQLVKSVMNQIHTGSLVEVSLNHNPIFICTPDHPICTGYVGGSDPSTFTAAANCESLKGWCPTSMQPSAPFTVKYVAAPTGYTKVYNLTVDTDECYIAGGVLVHNCQQAQDTALTLRPRAFVLEGPADWFEGAAAPWVTRWENAGYYASLLRVNARDFGLPQLRRRTFFIAAEVPLDLSGLSATEWPNAPTVAHAISDLESQSLETDPQALASYSSDISNAFQESARIESSGLSWHVESPGAPSLTRLIPHFKPGQHAGKIDDAILAQTYWKDRGKTVVRGGKGRPSMYYRRLDPKRPAPSLPGDIRFLHPEFDRFITPRESARLMGLPDWFTFAGLSSPRANLEAARTVSPRIAQVVATRVGECLKGGATHTPTVDHTTSKTVEQHE